MSDISISQSTFADLFIRTLTPTPDDDGRIPWPFRPRAWPHGPFPDPWDGGPFPEPWRLAPLPIPWTPLENLAEILERVIRLADAREVDASSGKAGSTLENILSRYAAGECETPWRKTPRPPPRPRDLLLIGALLEIRSRDFQGEELGELLSKTSGTFIEAGLKRMAG